jgi:hypothetical protein
MKAILSTLKNRHCLFPALCLLALRGTAFADATADIATGRAALVAHNIIAANTAFQQAVTADPTNEEANALYAFTRLVVLETTAPVQTLLTQMGVSGTGRDVFHWTAHTAKHARFPQPSSPLTTDNFKTVATNTLLPQIIDAEQNLEQITDTSFTTTLSTDETNLRNVTIDYGDIQILRSMLEAAITTVNIDDSYNTLVGFANIAAWYKTNALTLQHILSVYPKAFSFSTGVSVSTALSAFDASVTAFANGATFIQNRTDNTDRLFVIDPDKAGEEATFELDMQKMQASLATTVTFDDRTKVYLGELQRMTLPPRSYLPQFAANYAIAGTFPDPTFNGGLIAVTAERLDDAFTKLGNKLDKHFHYTPAPITPTVAIRSPRANAEISAANSPDHSVTVTGSAKAKLALDHVEVSLNSDDAGAFAVATGTSNWTVQFTNAQPGLNRVYARSIDQGGNVSVEQSRSFSYDVTEPLPVSVEPQGGGVVTPGFVPSSGRQLTKSYVIAATPAKGFIFQSWSNAGESAIYSAQASYTFTMTDGLSLQANFIPNPFPSLAGHYAGQLTDGGGSAIGSASFFVTQTGAFTGKLVYGGKSYALNGELDAFGNTSLVIPLGGNSSLHVSGSFPDIADASQGISVTVQAPGSSGSGLANHSPGTTNLNGGYTVLLQPDKAASDSPQGNGYGTITVSPNATVSFTGVLADGTPLTYSTTLTGSQGWTAYMPLYAGLGSFSEEMAFHIPPSPDDIDGTAAWIKPVAPKDKVFQQGFTASLSAIGSVYSKPAANTRALGFSNASPNSTVATNGGNLVTELQDETTLGAGNSLAVLSPGADELKLTIDLSTGTFTGSFFDIDAKTTRLFGGVVLQTENEGSGFFLGNEQSGVISLTPQ